MKRHNYRPHQSPGTEREDDWRSLGNCIGRASADLILFPLGEQFTEEQEAESAELCGDCPVKAQCLDFGRSARDWGTWGGVQSWEWGRGIGPRGERGGHGTFAAYRAHEVAGDTPVRCVPCIQAKREYYQSRRDAEAAA